MIDLPVTLTPSGGVVLPGHASALALGYTKNRGVYRLSVTASGEWEGLTIRAFWHVPGGSDPASSLVVDGLVGVPSSVTAQPGTGCITFEGSDGTRTVTSADLRYRVAANSGTEDGSLPEPGTPAWQELVDAVHTDATAAEQAKTDAQTAASEAATSAGNAAQSAQEAADSLQELKDGIAAGDFKGEKGDTGPQGPKGDVGPAGADGKDAPQIDDTTVTDSAPWSSKHIVDTLCPPLEETGNPVQCYPVENYPLGVKATWEPVQEGSGTPSPENIRPIKGRDTVKVERCGEQLLSYSQPIETDSDIRVAIMSSDQVLLLVNAARGQTFETSFDLETANVVWADYDEGWRRRIGFEAALTKASDGLVTYQIQCWINSTSSEFKATGKITVKNVITLLDDRYTESPESELFFYVQNMKSGHVKVTNLSIKLVQNTAYTPYQGDTLALRLPTTIYGGTVDAVSGESSRTWRSITLTGKESAHIYSIFFYLDLSEDSSFVIEKPADGKTGKSSHYPYAVYTNKCIGFTADGESLTYASNGKYPLSDEGLQEWKSYLAAQYAAGTPVQIAYKMATPEPFTATGAQPIPALPGVNTIMTDADSVTVTGRADPIKRITDLEDAVASMTNT